MFIQGSHLPWAAFPNLKFLKNLRLSGLLHQSAIGRQYSMVIFAENIRNQQGDSPTAPLQPEPNHPFDPGLAIHFL